MTEIKPCMGGWCRMRERCMHYTEPTNRHKPADRLCDQGWEREMFFMAAARREQQAEPALEAQ